MTPDAAARRSYDAVFFDMGHTLVRPSRPVVDVWADALEELGWRRDTRLLASAYERCIAALPAVDPETVIPPGEYTATWTRVYEALLDAAGFDGPSGPAVEAMWEGWLDKSWELYDEVDEVVAQLRARGYRLGVISNWDPFLERTCNALGIGAHFDVIVTSAIAGYAKPDVRIFGAALQRAGVSAGRAVHVGDRYDKDVAGALAAGMDAVLLDRAATQSDAARGGGREGFRTVTTLSSLVDLLS